MLKYRYVQETILARIRDGSWPASERIPSERTLADMLGVSRITVERAVDELVRDGRLERIEGRKGAFVPASDGSLASILIGVAIDDVRDRFGASLLRGIEDYLWDRKIHVLMCNGDRDSTKIEEYFHSMLGHGVSGVIFCPVIDVGYIEDNARLAGFLRRRHIPFVLMDRWIPGIAANYVGANHRESSRRITDLLVRSGHRRILVLVGLWCTSMEELLQGYRDALRDAGIPDDEALVVRANDNLLCDAPPEAPVFLSFVEAISGAGDFSCMYALNTRLFAAGISALRAAGRTPGEDVAVASHDQVPANLARYSGSLPYAVEPTYEMGREAARILVERIRNPDAPLVQITLETTVLENPEGEGPQAGIHHETGRTV